MISRYSRPEMSENWSLQHKFDSMLKVEIAVAEVQADLGIIPKQAAVDIRKLARFDLKRIDEIEATTKHDVIAFVSCVAENIGESGRYVHYGLTSSDVLDTALSLQICTAGDILVRSMNRLEVSLGRLIDEHEKTLCSGRTHGMHAEPTSFGFKMSGFAAELKRNQSRFERAVANCAIGKLSGAVGTYSTQPFEVEEGVCRKLGLQAETVATQVIPRDRHAEVFFALAMIGAGLERLAVELRHLQRTEVSEVVEGFSPGQKGSSAMPHKKNPISSENITGAARLLRGYLQSAMENVALWHERDISHSCVERVIFPDAFVLCDYVVDRMCGVLDGLFVDSRRMLSNMELSAGHLFSSHALLALVDAGLTREEAYRLVQAHAHKLKLGQNLKESLLEDKEVTDRVPRKKLDEIFSGNTHREAILKVIGRVRAQILRKHK